MAISPEILGWFGGLPACGCLVVQPSQDWVLADRSIEYMHYGDDDTPTVAKVSIECVCSRCNRVMRFMLKLSGAELSARVQLLRAQSLRF